MDKVENHMRDFLNLPERQQLALLKLLFDKMQLIKTGYMTKSLYQHALKKKERYGNRIFWLQLKLEKAISLLPKTKLRKNGFVHGDLHFNNILYDGSRLWAIDFEGSGMGDILIDISSLYKLSIFV